MEALKGVDKVFKVPVTARIVRPPSSMLHGYGPHALVLYFNPRFVSGNNPRKRLTGVVSRLSF